MENICIVSAFLDIGRQDWKNFQRSLQQYFNNFKPYTELKHEMIVFMDDKHIDCLKKICEGTSHIKILPINREWMKENIYEYQQLDREKEIMESDSFKNLVKHRLHHPECSKPEYNIIQHSKIDFLAYVINNKLSYAQYYAWSDFGYFQIQNRIPKNSLDLNKFNLEKINFQGISMLTNQDSNIIYTLTHAPEKVGGFFYLGRSDLLLKYQELYHSICNMFHKIGIVDDDQHIMIQCVFKEPSLFNVWNLGGWHLAYLFFQKNL
jgi:protein YibB